MNWKLIGEIIGVVALIESFFIYLSNDRKKILRLKGVSDALWAVNYFMIGAFTGGVLNMLMVFREFVFYHRLEKKWAQSRLWMYFFCMICFASPVIEFIKTGTFAILPLLPACGSVAAVFGFYDKNPTRIRILNFVTAIPWLIYNVYTQNITSTISGIVAICSIILGMVLAHREKKKQEG